MDSGEGFGLVCLPLFQSLRLDRFIGMKSLYSLLLGIVLIAIPNTVRAELSFEKGDRILIYGNSFAERMQEAGWFEAAIQLAHPDKGLEFRSLAWTGDELGNRIRPERYPNHLKKLLAEWPADVVLLVGFGRSEAFAGPSGREQFEDDLQTYIHEMRRRHEDATVAIVLPPSQPLPASGSKLAAPPEDLLAYQSIMQRVAEHNNVMVFKCDVGASTSISKLSGDTPKARMWEMSLILAREIVGIKRWSKVAHNRISDIANAVSQKASYVATLVRPVNAVIYFGVRGRPKEYEVEMARYHELVRKSDAIIQSLLAEPDSSFADYERPGLPPLDGAEKAEGLILSPAEMQETIKVAEGYKLNLFASEEQFPELRNPVQIAFGPKGRLWVVSMPSFPHTIPGEKYHDKILVLEDTDRDGVADKQTIFADHLNVPDGIAFYRDGVIVSAQPRHIYMWDDDDDGRADGQQELLRGIDVTDSHHGGMIAMDPMGHLIFCDGVFHRSQFETPFGVVRGVDATTYRFDLETGRITNEYQTITPNPWKVTFDRWGNLFHMYGDGFVQDSQLMPWTPLGVYLPFKRAISIAYGKGSGAAVISSPNFPDDYQQGMSSATLVRAHFVSLSKLNPESGFHKPSDRVDLLVSDNNGFRPADMAFGFDGAMYVSDFSCTIIGHAQNAIRDPRWDNKHGRIWRVIHTEKPVVKDWPDVAGSNAQQLLELLDYPQDSVRELVRARLRHTDHLVTTLDVHLNASRTTPLSDEHLLELLWLFESQKESRPQLLMKLLGSDDFRIRAAATRMIRFQAYRLPNVFDLLAARANDSHPRVRAEVINAVSHLQKKDAKWASLLGKVETAGFPVIQTMLADASYGTRPAKGREVPVLELPKDSQVRSWLNGNTFLRLGANGDRNTKEAVIRTYVQSDIAQTVILSLRHQHVRVAVNSVQHLDVSTWWSSDWNLQIPLRKGLNEIEVEFSGANRAQGIAPMFLFSPVGLKLSNVFLYDTEETLKQAAAEYARQAGLGENTIRLAAVPNQLAFAPKEITVKAGQKVKLLFDNPDHQIHNAVICKPGSTEKLGLLADNLALNPDAASQHYVPDHEDVLWSTPLVDAGKSITLDFTVPTKPGRYPILCTFPGHWRVMKSTLVVE